jgi:hypothetical protein
MDSPVAAVRADSGIFGRKLTIQRDYRTPRLNSGLGTQSDTHLGVTHSGWHHRAVPGCFRASFLHDNNPL